MGGSGRAARGPRRRRKARKALSFREQHGAEERQAHAARHEFARLVAPKLPSETPLNVALGRNQTSHFTTRVCLRCCKMAASGVESEPYEARGMTTLPDPIGACRPRGGPEAVCVFVVRCGGDHATPVARVLVARALH